MVWLSLQPKVPDTVEVRFFQAPDILITVEQQYSRVGKFRKFDEIFLHIIITVAKLPLVQICEIFMSRNFPVLQ